MSYRDIEDTIVNLQREQWLKEMEGLKEHTVEVWTHKDTDTTIVAEQDGSEISTGECAS